MSLHVTIHKDIGEYTEKVVGKLSFRTFICVVGGIGISILTAVFIYTVLHINVSYATMPIICMSMPFWLAGFWRPYNMKAEEFIRLWWAHTMNNEPLVYVSSCSKLQKEYLKNQEKEIDKKALKQIKEKGAELYEPSRGKYWIDGYRAD